MVNRSKLTACSLYERDGSTMMWHLQGASKLLFHYYKTILNAQIYLKFFRNATSSFWSWFTERDNISQCTYFISHLHRWAKILNYWIKVDHVNDETVCSQWVFPWSFIYWKKMPTKFHPNETYLVSLLPLMDLALRGSSLLMKFWSITMIQLHTMET